VSTNSLHKWVKSVKPSKADEQTIALNNAKKEILKLRADLRRVQEERDILKKAAVDSTGGRNRYSASNHDGEISDETYLQRGRA